MAWTDYLTQDNLILTTNALIIVLFLILCYMLFNYMNIGPVVRY